MTEQPGTQNVAQLIVRTHRGDQIDVLGAGGARLVMFIPAAFTPTCTQEVCDLGELAARAAALRVQIMVASCDAPATLARWLQDLGVSSTVLGLSDHWPHGALAKRLGAFDERFGQARRHSWAIRADGTRMRVAAVASGEKRTMRDHLQGVYWASEQQQT